MNRWHPRLLSKLMYKRCRNDDYAATCCKMTPKMSAAWPELCNIPFPSVLQAACKRFFDYCQLHRIALQGPGFHMSYDTSIPRQAGLSGSSAIVCAAINCLMQHYQVADQIPIESRPELVLSAENELGITAGGCVWVGGACELPL